MEGYVSKDEIKQYKDLFDNIIFKIRKDIKREGITFTHNLVGSGKRNLIVRHPTKGCDLDYQILLQKNSKALSPKDIKDRFRILFNKYKPSGYSDCEDSTSALTMKRKDTKLSKIVFSYDIVILRDRDCLEIIRRSAPNEYVWNKLKMMNGFNMRLKQICSSQMWNELRNRYYKKKIKQMNGETDKKSFQLLNEAVNEVLNYFLNS